MKDMEEKQVNEKTEKAKKAKNRTSLKTLSVATFWLRIFFAVRRSCS